MRDPEGQVVLTAQDAQRRLTAPLPETHFLHSRQAGALVEQGKLIAYRYDGARTISAPRVAFVSLPTEWCDAQLRAAADLTLEVARAALAGGFELKDASAWNVVFDGAAPRFCDHLSFQPIAARQWWAFGQFVRHFVFPLGVSARTGLRGHRLFRLHRDGLTPQEVRQLLGLRRFATRLWPLLGKLAAQGDGGPGANGAGAPPARPLHRNLFDFCEWSMARNGKNLRRNRQWQRYTATRSHYDDDASAAKRDQVVRWLESCAPAWVVDLGCNTGEYTRLAAQAGARVIAVDSDHDCVQQLFIEEAGNSAIHPVLADLADINGGGGWCGAEYGNLVARLQGSADVVLMLALIHHLAVSESIPFTEIAALAAGITRRWAVVELIGVGDPLLAQLARQRRRDPSEFGLDLQRAAFARHFNVAGEFPIPGTARVLVLLDKLR